MSWSRPGGESGVRSFGDEARLALACVVDQRAASKEAAQVGVPGGEGPLQVGSLLEDLVEAGVQRLRLARLVSV